jgi:hypothetical protein
LRFNPHARANGVPTLQYLWKTSYYWGDFAAMWSQWPARPLSGLMKAEESTGNNVVGKHLNMVLPSLFHVNHEDLLHKECQYITNRCFYVAVPLEDVILLGRFCRYVVTVARP